MKNSNTKLKRLSFLFIASIIVVSCFNVEYVIRSNYSSIQETVSETIREAPKSSSTTDNNQIITDIFSSKLSDFESLGYFPQIYEPSLQATFYALSILDSIDRLDTINSTAVLNYILSKYDYAAGIFMDKYAYGP